MGKNKDDAKGAKPKATNGDDVLVGTSRNDNLAGKKGNDQLSGLAGNDKLKGDEGNDLLDGGSGNDRLYGGKGDDRLLGGSGNDVLYGDGGNSHGRGWDKFCWWKPKSDDDDYLDGGAGSDKVYGGRGDDVAVYSMAGNLGAGFRNIGTKDDYDGGSGYDTLVLQLTYGEAALGSVKQDIAAFQKFLDSRANSRGDEFEFKSFNLDVSNFEALRIELTNVGPTANNDAGATSEDSLLVLAVLANDTDPDHLDVLKVTAVGASALGASVTLSAGAVTYDPTGAAALQALAVGESATDSFGYTITDLAGVASSAVVTVTITGVNDAPVAAADSNGDDPVTEAGVNPGNDEFAGDPDAAGNVLANDSDVDHGAVLSVADAGVRAGTYGTLHLEADGDWSYALDNADQDSDALAQDEVAVDAFQYAAADQHGASGAGVLSVVVTGTNDAPVAAGDAAATDEDTPLAASAAQGLLANDTDVDHGALLSVVAASAASGLGAAIAVDADGSYTYDASGAVALQALAAGESATDHFLYIVSDEHGALALAAAEILVSGVNDGPVANADVVAVFEDLGATIDVLANDTDVDASDTHTVDTATLASGLGSVSIVGNEIVYDPAGNYQSLAQGEKAEVVIEYSMSDNNGASSSSTATVIVRGANDDPDARDDEAAADEDAPLTIGAAILLGNDFDPDHGDVLSVVGVSESALGADVSLDAGGNVRYDARAVLQHLGAGEIATDTFTYTIEDSFGGSDTATVTLTVAGVNDAPEAEDDAYRLAEGGSLTVDGLGGVLANDTDVDGDTLSAILATGPAHGDLTLNADGSFTYTADANFDGTDSFTYRASDDGLQSGLATVKLSVAAVNRAPVAIGNSYSMNEDTTLLVTAPGVLGNDTDADGDALSAVLLSGPANGSLTLNANGAFSYTPNANFFGSDSFTYQTNDGLADSKAATVSIKIADVAEAGGSKGRVADAVPPGVELQYFMRVDGVTKDWVELDSFSLGLERTDGTILGGGILAGKLQAQDVVVNLGSSQSVAKLIESTATGKHLTKIEIGAFGMGEQGLRLVDAFKFEDVLVSSLQDSSGGNQIAFDYAKFGHSHVLYDQVGKKTGDIDTGYDFKAGKAGGDGGAGMPEEGAKQDDVAGELEYYVRFDGIGGSEQWLQLDSFGMGLSNAGGLSGAGTGVTRASDATLTLGSSRNLVELTTKLLSGAHIKTAEVEAYRDTGEGRQLVDEFRFDDVLISSLSTGNATHNTLSFDFTKYSHGHDLFSNDGKPSGFVAEGYDFKAAQAFDGPDPLANIDKGTKLADQAPPGADLQYYMRIEGVTKDWVQLDSFSLGLERDIGVLGGGGSIAGKLQAQDVVVSLGSSQSVAKLIESAAGGKHITKVEISAMGAGEQGLRLVDAFKFETVHVSSLQDSSGGNQIAFDYVKFGHSHVLYDEVGKKTGDVDTGYDFKLGKAGGDGGAGMPEKGSKQDDVGGELEYYVRFDGIGGSEQWLQLDSFSMGLTNTGGLSAGGGISSGQAAASDATLVLGSSKNLVELTTKLFGGTHIKTAEVEAYRDTGEGKQLVDEFRFDDVLISSLSTGNATHNTLTFDFAKYSHGHDLFGNDGKPSGFVAEGYDFKAAQAFDGPDPLANIDKGTKLADQAPPGADLQYYMRIEGVTKDWVELDSFSLGLEREVSASGGGGAGVGKLQAQDVVVSLGSSQSVAKLVEYAGAGKHITKVEISAMSAGEQGLRLVDAFQFEDVLVSSLQDGSGGNQIAFDYVTFGHSHALYDEVGKKTGDADTGYDIKLGKAGGDGGAGMPEKGSKQDDVGGELEYYVRFDGIGGSEQWLQLDSFSMGLTNTGGLSAGGGFGSGKAAASDVTLVLGSSKNLVDLTTKLSSGAHIKTAEIEAYRDTGEGRQLVDEFRFDNVLISSLTTVNATTNTLTFDFVKYSHGHELFGNDGKPSGFVAEGFDFAALKAFDGPDPLADIGFF